MTPAFTARSREQSIERLKTEKFDVLILGGGINGAGTARDLAFRARDCGTDLRIALVEQHHFASGTSGKNSQLIHGGLRYLKNLEFGLVREALRERATLLHLAPHLVEPLPFLIPMHGWFASAFYGTGLWIYDALAGRKRIARRRYLTRQAVARLEPDLSREDLTAAAIFYDCRIHSARFVLENIFDAVRGGAAVANYLRAEDRIRESGGYRVRLRDALCGEIFETRARKLVDATGPWKPGEELRLVRGSHIVIPRVNASDNAIAYFEESGRIIFVIPWGSKRDLSLVGTTDCDHTTGPDDVRISREEVDYLLRIVRGLYPTANLDVISSYSSLRPLLQSSAESPTKTSREHRIWNSGDAVLNIAGGKYTTYRAMSEEACDLLAGEIAPQLAGRCTTAERPLGGNSAAGIENLRDSAAALAAQHGVDGEDVLRLIRDYGVQAPHVLALTPAAACDGLTRVERATVAFAVRHEMARRLPDLLFVSTYWGYERRWSRESLLPFAAEMGRHLEWPQARIEQECDLVLRLAH
ncbi:MAG: glycerol-3-phosphate dehydrogenase/oxidase [Bryobacteraceae bacterium]